MPQICQKFKKENNLSQHYEWHYCKIKYLTIAILEIVFVYFNCNVSHAYFYGTNLHKFGKTQTHYTI